MKRGFTVVELLVVVTIIALLAGLAMFSNSLIVDRSRLAQAKSMTATISSALEKYYSQNFEYPSAESLANGGDGRNLSNAQYQTIATTLGLRVSDLQSSYFKFVPCAVSGSPCIISNSDKKYIMYMTRTSSDVAAAYPGPQRAYTTPSSGCDYRFLIAQSSAESGYTGYFLAYFDPSGTNWWTDWNVYESNNGRMYRGDYCPINRFG